MPVANQSLEATLDVGDYDINFKKFGRMSRDLGEFLSFKLEQRTSAEFLLDLQLQQSKKAS